MFDPAYDVRRIAVKRRQSRNPWFKRGHMFRAAIDVLREAGGPLETREITTQTNAAHALTARAPSSAPPNSSWRGPPTARRIDLAAAWGRSPIPRTRAAATAPVRRNPRRGRWRLRHNTGQMLLASFRPIAIGLIPSCRAAHVLNQRRSC
jgi:hypothetical protein